MHRQIGRVRTGSGFAENPVTFVAVLGQLDAAFAILQAYYFARGFVVPDVRFPDNSGVRNRFKAFLFMPPLAPLRRDLRFNRLIQDLEFQRYWRQPGHAMEAHLR